MEELFEALKNCDKEKFKSLLTKTKSEGKTESLNRPNADGRLLWIEVVKTGDLEVIQNLVEVEDLDVNAGDVQGHTALHFCVQLGLDSVLQHLVTAIPNLNYDKCDYLRGHTPVYRLLKCSRMKDLTIDSAKYKMLETLLERSANPNALCSSPKVSKCNDFVITAHQICCRKV